MANRFAMVLTCTRELMEQVTAAFNGLALFENNVDVHLLSKDLPESYIKALPSNFICPPWESIAEKSLPGDNRGGGWEVRFYRYRYAASIKDAYDAVMIIDADVFICGNFMELFEKAHKDGCLIMPDNPVGNKLERITQEMIDGPGLTGASSPPYHCFPFFFDPKKYEWLLKEVYDWGLKEPWGDMATLFRTLLRHNMHRDVVAIPNDLYVLTMWQYNWIRKSFDDKGRMVLIFDGDRIIDDDRPLPYVHPLQGRQLCVVHRRWAWDTLRRDYVKDLKGYHIPRGTGNVQVFKEMIDWLLANGPIKCEEHFSG